MKMMKLELNILCIADYQRPLDGVRARRIAERFDMAVFGVPVVSFREGKYWLVDGQTRTAGAKIAGLGDNEVWCEIRNDLTYAEEAALYLLLNDPKQRRPIQALDRYKARLGANDSVAHDIRAIVAKYNCKVSNNKTKGCITAFDSLEYAYHKGVLHETIATLNAWGEGSPLSFKAIFIRGFTAFYAKYPKAETARVVDRIKALSQGTIENRIRQGASDGGCNIEESARIVISKEYNHGLRTHKVLA